jgi:hypothetical protein
MRQNELALATKAVEGEIVKDLVFHERNFNLLLLYGDKEILIIINFKQLI